MAYLLIIREPRGQRAERSEDGGRQAYESMLRFGEALARRGVLVAAESLRDDTQGVRVSVRDGGTALLDGPFTESKEMVGGFFLIDVNSREQAVEIASQCPAARFATVEVRELAPCHAGWQESLTQLAQLVEPTVPDVPGQQCAGTDQERSS